MSVIVAVVVFLAALVWPATAQAAPTSVGVTGSTSWYREYRQTLTDLQAMGLPVHDGCTAGEGCITLSHYRADDGSAAVTRGHTGDATIRLNAAYDQGTSWYRRAVMSHEFGHALGLWNHGGCDTSMMPTVAMCGAHVVGYTPAEQAQLHQIWG